MRNDFEQKNIIEKIKEFRTLFIFIFLAAVFSVVVMDLIVFPVTLFAVSKKHLFSTVFMWTSLSLLVSLFTLSLFKRVFFFKKNGSTWIEAFLYFIKEKLSACASGMALLMVAALIIIVVYIVLNYNYFLLYEMTN